MTLDIPPRPGPALIAASILSADFSRLGEEVDAVLSAGADWIHFDVMDGRYVPNLTVGPMVCRSLRPRCPAPIDAHLMVEDPDRLAAEFVAAGADLVSLHCEACPHLDYSLSHIAELGARVGLVFNPATPLDYLDHVLDKVDLVLLMSVNPGFGGQPFIPSALPKIAALRRRLDRHLEETGHRVLLEVDGGVKADNAGAVRAAGADVLVAGSAIFGAGGANGYRAAVSALRRAAG